MSKSAWTFVAGFFVAASLGMLWNLRQEANAALARLAHEEQLAAQAESLQVARQELARAKARADSLGRDSARVYARWAIDREAAQAGVAAVKELARQARQRGDSTAAAALEGAAGATERGAAGCSLVLLNCEARASNATAAWHRAESQLDSTAAQLDTTVALWRSAERRAQPNFFRDIWRSRAVTLPLIITTVIVLIRK